MNRSQPLRQPLTHNSLLGTPTVADEMLPEHVLLRLLHEGSAAADETGEAQSHALELAAAIAAARALADSDEATDPDTLAEIAEGEGETECFDFDELAAELDLDAPQPATPDEEQTTMNEEDQGSSTLELDVGAEAETQTDEITTGASLAEDDAVEAADEEVAPEPSAAPEPQTPVDVAQPAMEKVEAFLGELRQTLVELAQPATAEPPQAIDIEPLVKSLQEGFERTSEQIANIGTQIEASVSGGMQAVADAASAAAAMPATPAAVPVPTVIETSRASRNGLVFAAVALLVFGWSVLFYLKTGSLRLALGTLVGANLVACCMLLAPRNRG
ncbi:MAG TPA: hypothetical protein ENI87_02630 [bacterium]|nr:hypothetical protein [bacterium]